MLVAPQGSYLQVFSQARYQKLQLWLLRILLASFWLIDAKAVQQVSFQKEASQQGLIRFLDVWKPLRASICSAKPRAAQQVSFQREAFRLVLHHLLVLMKIQLASTCSAKLRAAQQVSSQQQV